MSQSLKRVSKQVFQKHASVGCVEMNVSKQEAINGLISKVIKLKRRITTPLFLLNTILHQFEIQGVHQNESVEF